MAVGGLVGEAFIRVRPDTTLFAAETAAGVQAAVRSPVAVSSAARVGIAAQLASIRSLQSEIEAVNAKNDRLARRPSASSVGGGAALLRGGGLGAGFIAATIAAAGFSNVAERAAEDSEELGRSFAQASSEASELEGRIAHGVTPALIGFSDAASFSFGILNDELDKLGESFDAVFGTGGADAPLKTGLLAKDAIEGFSRLGPAAGLAGQEMVEGLRASTANLREEGGVAASRYVDAVTRTLIQGETEVVQAAQQTLSAVVDEGQRQIRDAIEQGNEAVRFAATNARSNLVAIGQLVAADALRLLEEGPLAQRIEQLQAQLNRSQAGTARRQLREDLADAERNLVAARRNLNPGFGTTTALQRQGQQRFLEPFQRDVKDAKDALGQFNTETVIGTLEAQFQAQKTVVQQGIADLVTEFTTGSKNVAQTNAGIASILEKAGITPYGKAGKRLGLAFQAGFGEHLDALRRQAIELAGFLGIAGPGTQVVSPGTTRRQSQENVAATVKDVAAREAAARDALRQAQVDLRKAINANTSSIDNLPDKMEAAVRAALKPAKKPTVATGPGSSGDRVTGRTP